MLLLGLVLIEFAAMCAGALSFALLILFPRSRHWALSTAAWFATFGAGVCLWIAFGTIALVLGGLSEHALHRLWHMAVHPPWLQVLGWVYLVVGLLGCAAAATLVAWVHQHVMERITFALFRIYVTAVVAGVGSVYGWVLGAFLLARLPAGSGWARLLVGGLAMLLLVSGFGWSGFRRAYTLRGARPPNWNPVTQDEFDGRQ